MPYLVDGNNLMHALAAAGHDVGREGLCRLLVPLVQQGQRVRVIYDGAPPPEGLAAQIAQTGVEVLYSGRASADDLLVREMHADSAPRLLTVVTSDREVRRAAEKRRCKLIGSEEFARKLLNIDAALRARKAGRPIEPKQKHKGLSSREVDFWLREFGFEEE